MSDIEHWTIWLMPDSEWPFCVERGISERQIAGVERIEVVRADLYRGAVSPERVHAYVQYYGRFGYDAEHLDRYLRGEFDAPPPSGGR